MQHLSVEVVAAAAAFFLAAVGPVSEATITTNAVPEYSNWFAPFYYRSCNRCPANGNLLPTCVKISVAAGGNIYCPKKVNGTPIKKVALDTCVTVAGSQVIGTVASARALSASATIAGSQVTCTADDQIDSSCIQLNENSFPADFVIPSSTTIDGSQITGNVQGSQVSGIVNASTYSTFAGTAYNLQCVSGQSQTAIGSCFTVNTALNASAASSLSCPSDGSNYTLPLCVKIPAESIVGTIPGSQIGSGINASMITTGSVSGNLLSNGVIDNSVTFNGTFGTNACQEVVRCAPRTAMVTNFTCLGNGQASVVCSGSMTRTTSCPAPGGLGVQCTTIDSANSTGCYYSGCSACPSVGYQASLATGIELFCQS